MTGRGSDLTSVPGLVYRVWHWEQQGQIRDHHQGEVETMTDKQNLSETSEPSATYGFRGSRTGRRGSRSALRRLRSKQHNHITYCETSIRRRCQEEV